MSTKIICDSCLDEILSREMYRGGLYQLILRDGQARERKLDLCYACLMHGAFALEAAFRNTGLKLSGYFDRGPIGDAPKDQTDGSRK